MLKKKKKKDENIWGDILNCIAMWYLKKGCLLSGVVNQMSLSVGEGRGGEGSGSIEQTRFTLAPKIICTDKFADIAHSTHLIE